MPTPKKVDVLSVTELTKEIQFQLSNEFSNVWVSGEVSGLTRPSSGHLYFTLKDKNAQISGIIWRSQAQRMKFELENGQHVICLGNVDVYAQRGNYQLIVRQAQPVGEGALQLAFRQLHAKLESEGLFDPDKKQSPPKFPRRVAVITSPSGAAVRDFLQVLDRRWSNLHVIIIPVKVQGTGSAEEIVRAIGSIERFSLPPDVVVLTRGGGSIEDLWSFNEEQVCRAIAACPIPVICGVGHEIDVTLADLVADVRALTPSEAAERLIPDRREITSLINAMRTRLGNGLVAKYRLARQQLETLAKQPVLMRPLEPMRLASMELDRYDTQMLRAIRQRLTNCQHETKQMTARLESINPLSVLGRGYSLTTNTNGKLLTSCDQIEVGDTISTRLATGTIRSKVESKQHDGE